VDLWEVPNSTPARNYVGNPGRQFSYRVATYFVFAFLLAAILETMIATLGR